MAKTFCPRHEDKNPSCEIYEDSAFCFSGCGRIPLSELGLQEGPPTPRPKEDIEATLEQIKQLPEGYFRGFMFPYDRSGFYILWPNSPFYKKRLFDPKAKSKYLAPTGHKIPLFWARKAGNEGLAVVEGELEALSVAEAFEYWDVVSPGAATNFSGKPLVQACFRYQIVLIAVDNDPAGIQAATALTSLCIDRVPRLLVIYKHKERDFNKVFCDLGVPGLRSEIEERLSQAVCWGNPG